jgi:hypothetical protein
MKTTDLAAFDERIAAAQQDIDAAQNRYRNRPRSGARMGGPAAPMRIDREARAHMLDLGLEVDRAVIRLEQLKKQRAEAAIAALDDPEAIAAETAAIEAAQQELAKAEAQAVAARTAYRVATGARNHRAERIKTQRAEIARAEAAIASAEKLAERESAERVTLVPA